MKHTSSAVDASELTREHLEELLSSQTFQRSPKLSQLLRRLIEPTLTGDTYPLKEQLLGIEVFDRPTDWDPQTDSIVRVNVNRLRLMLTSYYADQNPQMAVRFVIPKGSYTAQCVLISPQSSALSRQLEPSNDRTARNEGNSLGAPAPSLQGRPAPRLPDIRLQRLTSERGDVTNAAFCPDGESVVYSARWGGEPARIYSQRIGQKYSRPLGLPFGELRDVSDTGQVLFTLGEGSIGTLAQAELSGGPWREIVEGVLDAVWLPNNKDVAAARVEGGSIRVELPLGNPIHCVRTRHNSVR